MSKTTKWMEIFHSKPSMQRCYMLEKLPSGDWAQPCIHNQLLDAGHVRPAFRVMRRRATRVEFVLTDGTSRNWDDNYGNNYIIDGVPGRYVVEHGIRRVGDADEAACIQTVLRNGDRYIHLAFRADLWRSCYAYFSKKQLFEESTVSRKWTELPGELMTRVQRPGQGIDHQKERRFELIIEAKALSVAFNDGHDNWDSNNGNNYHIGMPGKYIIADGHAMYKGPSDKDLQLDPKGTPRPDVIDPIIATAPSSANNVVDVQQQTKQSMSVSVQSSPVAPSAESMAQATH